jgi:DNA mismatch endonuclease (patch repair protein)
VSMDNLSPEQRSSMMRRIKSKDTGPEILVRRLVYEMGYRYRLHDKRLQGKPDLAFIGRRKAIFVNGCFWHGHEECSARLPKSNQEYWKHKIECNRARDTRNVKLLRADGWKVLILWECELADIEVLRRTLRDFIAN